VDIKLGLDAVVLCHDSGEEGVAGIMDYGQNMRGHLQSKH